MERRARNNPFDISRRLEKLVLDYKILADELSRVAEIPKTEVQVTTLLSVVNDLMFIHRRVCNKVKPVADISFKNLVCEICDNVDELISSYKRTIANSSDSEKPELFGKTGTLMSVVDDLNEIIYVDEG